MLFTSSRTCSLRQGAEEPDRTAQANSVPDKNRSQKPCFQPCNFFAVYFVKLETE